MSNLKQRTIKVSESSYKYIWGRAEKRGKKLGREVTALETIDEMVEELNQKGDENDERNKNI